MEYKKDHMYLKKADKKADSRKGGGWKTKDAPEKVKVEAEVKAEVMAEAEVKIEVPKIKFEKPVTLPGEIEEVECGYCITPGMAYVPMQKWGKIYEAELALSRGTLFPELDLPFIGKGACDE